MPRAVTAQLWVGGSLEELIYQAQVSSHWTLAPAISERLIGHQLPGIAATGLLSCPWTILSPFILSPCGRACNRFCEVRSVALRSLFRYGALFHTEASLYYHPDTIVVLTGDNRLRVRREAPAKPCPVLKKHQGEWERTVWKAGALFPGF